MKRILTISIFVLTSTVGFAQYHHVQLAPSGTIIEDGQYSADPGITANDSKETIAQKMSLVHKTGNWTYKFESGTSSAEEHYTTAGLRTGIWKTWYSTGTLASEINYATGASVFYHGNGTKVEEGIMNGSNQRTGNWSGWHENGTLNYTGSWSVQGFKTGVWQYYDNNGQVVATEHWNNGVMSN